jgi:hypothetical protein
LVGQPNDAVDLDDDPCQGTEVSDDIPSMATEDLGVSVLVAESLGNLLLN